MAVQTLEAGKWTSGLCGCFEDGPTCCYGYQVPCVLYGDNVSRITGEGCACPCLLMYCCCCFACIFGGNFRGKLRAKYNLAEEPCSDCCVYFWCTPCAVCQEAREIKRRGV